MPPQCSYEDCNEVTVGDGKFCIFHAPPQSAKRGSQEFNKLIKTRLLNGNYNFRGFVFPFDIRFTGHTYRQGINFSECEFHGNVDFSEIQFPGGVDFSSSKFYGEATFSETTFKGKSRFVDCGFWSETDFTDAVFEQKVDFRSARFRAGCIFVRSEFKKEADFRLARFKPSNNEQQEHAICADFRRVTFQSDATFNKALFLGGAAKFDRATFSGDSTNFMSCRFRGHKVKSSELVDSRAYELRNRTYEICAVFEECHFDGRFVSFSQAQFERGLVNFQYSQFNCESVAFVYSRFSEGVVTFVGVDFHECSVNFTCAKFLCSQVDFYGHDIDGNLIMQDVEISSDISFDNVRFKDGSRFVFSDPTFLKSGNKWPRILFKRVHFNPFLTYFENFSFQSELPVNDISLQPTVLLRECALRNVYFVNNNMGLFSFFTCPFFEEAHFVSPLWMIRSERLVSWLWIPFKRKNQLMEEQLLSERLQTYSDVNDDEVDYYETKLLTKHWQVAELYRRMKTAADRIKDYNMASWFYFNEFEMKRMELLQKYKDKEHVLGRLRRRFLSPRLWLFNLYRVLAGYGEKPIWTITWFSFSTIIFALLHLFNGFSDRDKSINFDMCVDLPNLSNLDSDMFSSLLFSLYHLIPLSYFRYGTKRFAPEALGNCDVLLSLTNSVVLIMLLVFVGIGLKRQFRRF